MTEALHFIRKAIIDRLTNAITVDSVAVPVINRVSENTNEPYIKVNSISNKEIDQNKTSFNSECITRIEVVNSFVFDDGGELQTNQIVSEVLRLIRTRSAGYYDLSSDNFRVYTCENENTTYFEENLPDKTYFRAVIEISNRVEKL